MFEFVCIDCALGEIGSGFDTLTWSIHIRRATYKDVKSQSWPIICGTNAVRKGEIQSDFSALSCHS